MLDIGQTDEERRELWQSFRIAYGINLRGSVSLMSQKKATEN